MSDLLSFAEYIDVQNEIIKEQADALNELIKVLLQHVPAEELEAMPFKQKIYHAAQLREEIGG